VSTSVTSVSAAMPASITAATYAAGAEDTATAPAIAAAGTGARRG
jgi:hypothetical protein